MNLDDVNVSVFSFNSVFTSSHILPCVVDDREDKVNTTFPLGVIVIHPVFWL